MSLIIGAKGLPQLLKGYPTVSDKYDVTGGVLEGEQEVKFGQVMTYGSVSGSYLPATALAKAEDVAGIVCATNVKLARTYPGSSKEVTVMPGEALNLMVKGFIAVEVTLKEGTTASTLKEGSAVYVTPAGEITNDSASTNFKLDAKFMGITEPYGEGKCLAEICFRQD